MAEIIPKGAMRAFLDEAISMAVASKLPIGRLQGVALFNPVRDEPFTRLQSFHPAIAAVSEIPNFITTYGGLADVMPLHFLYQYFARVDSIQFDENIFLGLWDDFWAELQAVDWVARGVANLKFFATDNFPIDLKDGITIQGRSPPELMSLGFSERICERLFDELMDGHGHTSYVLVTEHKTAKEPGNVHSIDTQTQKAQRAIQALRLSAPGFVSIGPIYEVRATRFNVGIGGLRRMGASIPTIGFPYLWTENIAQLYPIVYRELALLEKDGYGKAPGNLAIALRAFMATYDRWPSFPDSQLLDAFTALEALLGDDKEISFKLAFRVASLLAASDEERGALLKSLKSFYDTRSTIVHGGRIRQKHQRDLERVEELRSHVRRLLRSFVAFAASPSEGYNKDFFKEELDVALVDGTARERLRTALGLQKPREGDGFGI